MLYRYICWTGALRAKRAQQLRQALPGESQPAPEAAGKQNPPVKPSSEANDQPSGKAVSDSTADGKRQDAQINGGPVAQQEPKARSTSQDNSAATKGVPPKDPEPGGPIR